MTPDMTNYCLPISSVVMISFWESTIAGGFNLTSVNNSSKYSKSVDIFPKSFLLCFFFFSSLEVISSLWRDFNSCQGSPNIVAGIL